MKVKIIKWLPHVEAHKCENLAKDGSYEYIDFYVSGKLDREMIHPQCLEGLTYEITDMHTYMYIANRFHEIKEIGVT